jgi:hypothetical protein
MRFAAMGQGSHPWRGGFFALPMPSATIGGIANTPVNPGIYSDTNTECDPGGDADCDTDGGIRYPSSDTAHRDAHT